VIGPQSGCGATGVNSEGTRPRNPSARRGAQSGLKSPISATRSWRRSDRCRADHSASTTGRMRQCSSCARRASVETFDALVALGIYGRCDNRQGQLFWRGLGEGQRGQVALVRLRSGRATACSDAVAQQQSLQMLAALSRARPHPRAFGDRSQQCLIALIRNRDGPSSGPAPPRQQQQRLAPSVLIDPRTAATLDGAMEVQLKDSLRAPCRDEGVAAGAGLYHGLRAPSRRPSRINACTNGAHCAPPCHKSAVPLPGGRYPKTAMESLCTSNPTKEVIRLYWSCLL